MTHVQGGDISADDPRAGYDDDATANRDAEHIYDAVSSPLAGFAETTRQNQVRAVSRRAAALTSADVEMRVIDDNVVRVDNGAGMRNVLRDEPRRRFSQARLIALVGAALALATGVLGLLLGMLFKERILKAFNASNVDPGDIPSDPDAAKLLDSYQALSEDEVWQRVTNLIENDKPPLTTLAYVLFVMSELAPDEAPWEIQLGNDRGSGRVDDAGVDSARQQRWKELFDFAEKALATMLQGVDATTKKLQSKSLTDAVDQVKDLQYPAVKLAGGTDYLDDVANCKLGRREKLLVLHYAALQALRLLGQPVEVKYDLYWTLVPDQDRTAWQTLAFSSLKVDSGTLGIVLSPVSLDVQQVDWTFTPKGGTPASQTDRHPPCRYLATGLQDQHSYTAGATLTFRPSTVLNGQLKAGPKSKGAKSFDKDPVKLSADFDIDNS